MAECTKNNTAETSTKRGRSSSKSQIADAPPQNLETPFVEFTGAYIKNIWIGKAENYGIKAKKPLHGYTDSYFLGILNTAGSVVVAMSVLLQPETLLGFVLASLSTLLYWYYGQYLATNMSWNVISFGLLFPITQNINAAFIRREQALNGLAHFRGNFRSLWGGIHTWQVPSKDSPTGFARGIEKMGQGDLSWVKKQLQQLADELLTAMICYFNATRWHRARHVMGFLQPEQIELQEIAHEQRIYVDSCMARFQRVVQDMKVNGLPGSEANRLDQYITECCIAIEQLSSFKEYRTPQLFRAYSRIYIQMVGVLYGPYYLTLARGDEGNGENIGFAIAYALAIQFTLSGLYHVMLGLEDPFARLNGRGQIDSVRVPELFEMIRRALIRVEEDADAPWSTSHQHKNNTNNRTTKKPEAQVPNEISPAVISADEPSE